MNTTRIAVAMFSVAAVSLFTANFHLRKEFTEIINQAPVVTTTLPEVTIVADKPVIPLLATNNEAGVNCSAQDEFNKEKGTIAFTYSALPGMDVFKKKGDIITFNTNATPGLVFRLQVLASTEQVPLFSSAFYGLNDIHEEYIDGVFSYTAGNFSTPGRALPLYLKLEGIGYRNMFIVAYKDGKRIRLKDAENEMMMRRIPL